MFFCDWLSIDQFITSVVSVLFMYSLFFFFKHKTAYEMRISDWSSDVCSSDLVGGIKTVRQGFHDYGRSSIIEGTDPRGFPYYWFGLGSGIHTPDHGTDLEAAADNYITVTPLHLDLTHYESLDMVRAAFAD